MTLASFSGDSQYGNDSHDCSFGNLKEQNPHICNVVCFYSPRGCYCFKIGYWKNKNQITTKKEKHLDSHRVIGLDLVRRTFKLKIGSSGSTLAHNSSHCELDCGLGSGTGVGELPFDPFLSRNSAGSGAASDSAGDATHSFYSG